MKIAQKILALQVCMVTVTATSSVLAYDGRGGIWPAHQTTADSQMRSKGPNIYRKFRQLAERVGDKQAFASFSGLHPFVQNTYGDKVPVINIQPNTKTGVGRTNSGGVVSNTQLSNALLKKGPIPKDMRAIIKGTSPAPPKAPMYACLRGQPAAAVALSLMNVGKNLLPKSNTVDGWHRLRLPTGRMRAVFALGLRMPGRWTKKVNENKAIIVKKTGSRGSIEITYQPGSGISYRVEDSGRSGKPKGYAVAFGTKGLSGSINVLSSQLGVQPEDPRRRFVPTGDKTAHGLEVGPDFQKMFGL